MPGLLRGRLHSAIIRAMKPLSGSDSLALTSWFTWSGAGESPLRRSKRQSRAGEIGQGFTDGNQLAAWPLHGFILPSPCLATVPPFFLGEED